MELDTPPAAAARMAPWISTERPPKAEPLIKPSSELWAPFVRAQLPVAVIEETPTLFLATTQSMEYLSLTPAPPAVEPPVEPLATADPLLPCVILPKKGE